MGLGLVLALAALQGVTEFLPISSSGHLRLLQDWAGLEEPQTLFDVVLHVGTLLPIVAVYRGRLGAVARASGRVLGRRAGFATEPDARLLVAMAAGTVATGIVGVGLGPAMEALTTDIRWVGAALAVNGVLLLGLGWLQRRADAGTRAGRGLDELRPRDVAVVGVVQGLAVFRGISRSGSTIAAGVACGLHAEAAATFSFLLAVPAIPAALVFELASGGVGGAPVEVLLLGGVAAAATGTVALLLLLRMLRGRRLHHFAWYCFALAALAIYAGTVA